MNLNRQKMPINAAWNSIQRTRQGFEQSFAQAAYYDRQTQDETHLSLILQALPIKPGMRILDLGTGTGYLAFALAKKHPDVRITGLDIAAQTMRRNQDKVDAEQLDHLNFISYDGLLFPFADQTFDMVAARYTLHHFPLIDDTFGEISRILKPGGMLFLSDPAPNDNDTDRFVDAYMQMKPDGHIRFYTKTEWQQIAGNAGLILTGGFKTQIRFPRQRQTACELDALMQQTDPSVTAGYDIAVTENEIWITERVNNLLFVKENKARISSSAIKTQNDT